LGRPYYRADTSGKPEVICLFFRGDPCSIALALRRARVVKIWVDHRAMSVHNTWIVVDTESLALLRHGLNCKFGGFCFLGVDREFATKNPHSGAWFTFKSIV
jgi:hypothetical protein